MKRLQDIKQAVTELSPEEFEAFRAWFAEFDADNWDRQIEADVAAGRLDELCDRALQQYRNGECSDL